MDEQLTQEELRALHRFFLFLPVLEAVMRELPRDPEKAAKQMRALEDLSKLSAPLSAIIEDQRAHAAQIQRNGERLTLYLKIVAVIGSIAAFREVVLKWLRDGP